MGQPSQERVRRHRQALRAAGLRPLQIWVPDTRKPGFKEECQRQARLAARSDDQDTRMNDFLDAALADLPGDDEA